MKKIKVKNEIGIFTKEEWPLWLVVHHFLPSELLVDLMKVVVSEVTDSKSSLNDLFEIYLGNENNLLRDIPIRPKELSAERNLESSLQRLLRGVFWSYDDYDIWAARLDSGNTIHEKLNVVALSLNLGAGDFENLESCFSRFSENELKLYPLLKTIFSNWISSRKELNTSKQALFIKMESIKIDPILKSLLEKYVGDQYADLGDWTSAKIQYQSALALFNATSTKHRLTKEINAWKDQCLLSIAVSVRVLEGPESAANLISHQSAECDLQEHPVLGITGSLDAMAYAFNLSEAERKSLPMDVRGTFIQPSFLSKNLDTASAFQKWLSGKQPDAYRAFWSVLRRQIANGSDVEARASKHWYANSLLDRPCKEIVEKDFLLAFRLLIESERSNEKEKFQIDSEVIRTHFSLNAAEFGYTQAIAYQGVKLRRLNVLMELYRSWLPHVELIETKRAICRQVLKVAESSDVSFQSELDAAGSAFEALVSFAKVDTTLRREFANDVATLLEKSLSTENRHWKGVSLPLDAAIEYVEFFDDKAVKGVVNSVLSLLDKITPKAEMWPIVRPAMKILTSTRVKDWVKSNQESSSKILEQILRYGLEDASLRGEVLFNLMSWNEKILKEPAIRVQLEPVIGALLKDSKAFNSSACVSYIRSLLLASTFLTKEEFQETVGCILSILDSVKDNGQHPMAFTDTYLAILILVEKYEVQIIPDEKKDLWFQEQKNKMLEQLIRIWHISEKHHNLFQEFSLPRKTYPNKILVNNWVATSIRLARDCGKLNLLDKALDKASMNKELTSAVMKARVSENLFIKDRAPDLFNMIQTIFKQIESLEEFYKILPTIISAILRLDTYQSQTLIEELLKMTLNYGPNMQDASVFVAYLYQKKDGKNMIKSGLDDYESRLKNSSNSLLRDSLSPLFFRLKDQHEG